MAQHTSRKTKPVLECDSHKSKACHVASSHTWSKVSFWAQDPGLTHQVNQAATTTQLDAISGEEFNLNKIGEDKNVTDNPPNGPLTKSTSLHSAMPNVVLNAPWLVCTCAVMDQWEELPSPCFHRTINGWITVFFSHSYVPFCLLPYCVPCIWLFSYLE